MNYRRNHANYSAKQNRNLCSSVQSVSSVCKFFSNRISMKYFNAFALYKQAAIANTRQTFITFATMKGYFKIFVLLLITCCYANTVFEFSDKEKENNFENESHCYIQQANNNNAEFSVTQSIPFSDLIFNTPNQHSFLTDALSLNSSSFYENIFYPPPDKIYLLHSSLLI